MNSIKRPDAAEKLRERLGCSVPSFAVEILARSAVGLSFYTVGIVRLCRGILC